METTAHRRRIAAVRWSVYAALVVFIFTDQFGQTTSDTRLDLTNAPIRWLHDSFWLWNPRVSLGEMQNQAYGYLFPQGPFFALGEWWNVPGWVSERAWSVLVLLVACEGLRRVARAIGAGELAATIAGLGYGLSPRMVAELGVRSAEILPGAVLPWAFLPLVYLVQRRLSPLRAAVLSAAAFACAGGVNGTATAAPAALLIVVVLWAWRTRAVTWRFAVGWAGLMTAVNLWWVLALLRLGAYSPPFFDYVEDAPTTTSSAGFAAGLRGASNWVDYIVVSGYRWWPAGWDVSFVPWIVLGSGVVAVLGVIGLARHRGDFATPLRAAAVLGIACVCIAHVGPFDSPLSPWLRDQLDGALAPLRNVPKADPILRVPLCLGLAFVVDDLLDLAMHRARLRRRLGAAGLIGAIALSLVAMSWPVMAGHLRTPGWGEFPSYWTQASDYLDSTDPDQAGAVWVVPGSGFGIEQWGWTMEEPIQVLGQTRWVTRSQVPLTPAPTIRMLSTLESYLETGAGSPYLSRMLQRIGVDRILLRHDLEVGPAQGIDSGLVSRALARSPGITRAAEFGQLDFGPAIEIFDVGGSNDGYRIRDASRLVTVATSVEDVIAAVGAGLVGDDDPVAVAGETGWRTAGLDQPVDIQGDGFRRRERNFGRVHDAESNVMAADDPDRGGRVVPNYPGPPGASPVRARYAGISGVEATSSNGYADVLGPVRPETAPWSALDGDQTTYWLSAPYLPSTHQGIDLSFAEPRTFTTLTLDQPTSVVGLQTVPSWAVTAGGRTVIAHADPVTGQARVDLRGVRADAVQIRARDVERPDEQIGLAEVDIAGVTPHRSLVMPAQNLVQRPDLIFTAAPETRACNATLLGPDCSIWRQRPSEEATGIDRTLTLTSAGRFRLTGAVVARSRPATAALLAPLGGVQVTGSSWLDSDPAVAPRMAADADLTTSWISDPRDPHPWLSFDLGRRRTISGISVAAPADPALRPTHAVITADGVRRTVSLSSIAADGEVRFEPFTARRVRVAFSRAGRDGAPLGAAEVNLHGGHVSVALDGGGRTGSICGYGPNVVVDGRTYPTRVRGVIGAVVADARLGLESCAGPIALGQGTHRIQIVSTEQFQPVEVQLRSRKHTEQNAARTLRVTSRGRTEVGLKVSDGPTAILSAPQSFNPGWIATLQGRELTPVQVDGWAQGWVVPAGESGQVELVFAPQRGYLIFLIAGLVLMGAVVLSGLAFAVRTRVQPAAVGSPGRTHRAVATGGRRVVLIAVSAVAGGVIGGGIVAAAALLGAVLGTWGRGRVAALVLGGVAMLAGVIVSTALVAQRNQLPDAWADLLTAAGMAVALAAALTARREPR